MATFTLKYSEIESPNIVANISQEKDIHNLSFLELDKIIVQDIKKQLKEKKNGFFEYFLGGKQRERLYVFINTEKTEEKKSLFYGEHFPKLPERICIIASTTAEKELMFTVCELSRYQYQEYKKGKKRKTEVLVGSREKSKLQKQYKRIKNIFLARDLGNMPSNELTPEAFVSFIKDINFDTVKVKVLDYKDICKNKMGLIEGVGKGSSNKPYMVILEHIPYPGKTITGIVGKGVTFDTGGNQIKPGDHMYEMKGDMGGAAVVLGVMKEIDRQNIDKNYVACLCLAENSVSSESYKPSDILTAYNKKTVEVIHTDAEGRLVLADGMSYVSKKYKTDAMITVATLTGAVMVALGFRYAGIMGTDDKRIESLLQYSQDHTEKYVRLPYDEYFIDKTKSEIADLKNLDRSVHAGSSMGAAFLSNFLDNNEKYTHIDIAGTYINDGDAYGKMPRGMTGFGVESLGEVLCK